MGAFSTTVAAALFDSTFPGFSVPDTMKIQVVADEMRLNGLNAQIYQFESPDSIEKLAEFFKSQWPNELTQKYIAPWEVLSHSDGKYLLTVQIKTLTFDRTQGLITITDIFKALEESRTVVQPDIPMMGDTQLFQHLEANDYGRKSDTWLLFSNESVHQNLEYYRTYFRNEGFEPISLKALAKGDAMGAMILNRGAEQLNFTAMEHNGRTLITIVKVRQ